MTSPFTNALRSAFKNALWLALGLRHRNRRAPLRVRHGPARGAVLLLDVRSQSAYWIGRYDEWILRRVPIARFLREGQVAWDCGAFVGYYTAVFRARVGAQGSVVTFEASHQNAEYLLALPALNGWNNVAIRAHAVGPDHTTLQFAGNLGGASGPWGLGKNFTQAGIALETVQSCGVDELVYELGVPAPDFIKFDLETGEIHALRNGDRLFQEKRPVILLELHGAEATKVAGEFLARFNYAGALIERLPEYSDETAAAWESAFTKIAARNGADLAAIGYEPHMLFCLPAEKCP